MKIQNQLVDIDVDWKNLFWQFRKPIVAVLLAVIIMWSLGGIITWAEGLVAVRNKEIHKTEPKNQPIQQVQDEGDYEETGDWEDE